MKINHLSIRKGRLALTILTLSTLISCSKSDRDPFIDPDPELTHLTVQAEADGEMTYDDVFIQAMGSDHSVAIGGMGIFDAVHPYLPGRLQSSCFKIAFTPTENNYPVTITIDFGTEGCLGIDGRLRKGKISTVYTGHMVFTGNKATTTFDGYEVNGIKVEGSHTIENTSKPNQWSFETRVEDGRLTRANGNQISWNRIRQFTMVAGSGTTYYAADDIFNITSNGSGTITVGNKTGTWTSTTISPLEKRSNCKWITAGVQEIKRVNGKTALLDFGNGDCQNTANITVNGVSREITLK